MTSPALRTWQRFKSNKAALAGLCVILLSVLAAVFAYVIVPDNSPDANRMSLPTARRKPGSAFTFLRIPKAGHTPQQSLFYRLFFGEQPAYEEMPVSGYRFTKDTLRVRPFIGEEETAPEEAYAFSYLLRDGGRTPATEAQKAIVKNHLTARTYWLGTDTYGRDMLSRLVIGGRISMAVGFVAVLISLLVGISLGAVAGYFGGRADAVLSWLMNVLWALPALLLVIALSFALGKGFWQVFLAIGLSMWVDVARLVRGQVMALKQVEYIEAGLALGFSHARIITRHMLPNLIGPILVLASGNFASAILLEAGLSFLGFGAQPPAPTWGNMIKEHYGYIVIDGAYLAVLPGLAIMILVYAFNLVTIGLRDAFDIRSQQTRD